MSKKPATPTPELTLSETRVTFLPLSMFSIEEGYNLRRFDPNADESDKAFLKTIMADGKIRDPLTARVVDGKAEIQAGHRRYLAALEAERAGIKPFPALPVLSVPTGQTDVDRTYDLFTSNSGKPLSPIEQAAGVKRLADKGEKLPKIAAKAGVTTEWVRNLLRMADMPEYLAEAVYAGHIGSTLAVELLGESGRKGFDLRAVWDGAAAAARQSAKWDATAGRYVWRVTQKHIDPILVELGKAMDKSRNRPPAPGVNAPDKSDDKPADDKPADDKPEAATKSGKEMPAPAPKPGAKPAGPSDAEIAGVTSGVPLYRLDNVRLWVTDGKGERLHECWTIRDHNGQAIAFAASEELGRSLTSALITAARITKTVVAAPAQDAPVVEPAQDAPVVEPAQDAPVEPVKLVPNDAHKPAKGSKRRAA